MITCLTDDLNSSPVYSVFYVSNEYYDLLCLIFFPEKGLPLSDLKASDLLLEIDPVEANDPRLKYHAAETYEDIPELLSAADENLGNLTVDESLNPGKKWGSGLKADFNVKLGPGAPQRKPALKRQLYNIEPSTARKSKQLLFSIWSAHFLHCINYNLFCILFRITHGENVTENPTSVSQKIVYYFIWDRYK